MDYRTVFEVSAAGMDFEKKRLELATLNLANMHTSSAPGAAAFKPLRAVASPLTVDFASLMVGDSSDGDIAHVTRAVNSVPLAVAPHLLHEPGHPHADDKGMVSYPGVDQASEMIIAMTALRSYEANVAAAGMARAMAARALEIGGQ
jgi:flagellar basal-body rod protein FlgC